MEFLIWTEGSLKTRMELIKLHAIQVLQELKAKAEEAYTDMNNWLGSRFIQEMDRYGPITGQLSKSFVGSLYLEKRVLVDWNNNKTMNL